jgi:UDP-N-acetylglucosamine diphosphorylase / glucose-1-phosphate thymidylyltransferase / UDP-N-acetylgalactosamine diphosphorylase / glucosamine-1-phosphate N-acetyltransferase / galactosamine-1-phosphate N-acetyltransferase
MPGMQAVVLAAGRGTRMNELTTAVPKPMLDVAGRPLLEYKLDVMPAEINEVILIVGYLKEVIKTHFGENYAGKRIHYVEQKDMNGTAGALWSARSLLRDRFLVMMGDDIYHPDDVAACIEPSPNWKLLVQQLPEMHRAGSVQLGNDGTIADIIESAQEDETRMGPGIASTNMYVLDTRLFTAPLVPKHAGSLEYGLPQTVVATSKQFGVPLEPVFTEKWIQITAPKDLVEAVEMLQRFDWHPA